MSRLFCVSLILSTACFGGTTTVERSPVRASLEDGQILQGLVSTTVVRLRTPMGTMAVPVGHVGEIEPIEGGQMEDSHNHVKLWLRNGSELVGEWADPELEFHLDVGDKWVTVDLPMNQMERFQLRDGEQWPQRNAFSVSTSFGDDFIVDTKSTQFTITNNLGEFSPFLEECRSLAPVGDASGDWRVELFNGSVLIGPLKESQITFALPLGPETISVPLEHITKLERTENIQPAMDKRSSPAGWFDNGRYRELKQPKQKQIDTSS